MHSLLHGFIVALPIILTAVAGVAPVRAQKAGALLVNPKRLVFEGQKRNDLLSLINMGRDTATYNISMVEMQMNEDGEMSEVTTPDPKGMYADKIVRFFPKQITLAPKESQSVRVQILMPSDLASGEYRSYLYFRGVKKAKELTKLEDTTKGLKLSVSTIFGVAIPVIVRHNTTPSIPTISRLTVAYDSSLRMQVCKGIIYRSGTQSIYGSLVIKFVENGGRETVLSTAKGLAIYVPNPMRKFRMPLSVPKGMNLTRGKIVVEMQTYTDATKEAVMASAELPLP
jgi:P pilus assembly chaperone PapD